MVVYERVLQDIKKGALVTKSIDGVDVDQSKLDDDIMMTFAIKFDHLIGEDMHFLGFRHVTMHLSPV